MRHLVIVESPSKAKTIEKYLGKDYKVTSSKGHIADLPKSQLGVDVDKKFEPTYVVTKEATLKQLKKSVKQADDIVLAVDPDREGEAIGWHVARELGLITKTGNKKKGAKPVSRIVFTEITKQAVQDAVKKPRELNFDLIDAQQARRVLDRLVGYKLSPLLWKKIRFGLSAGRVQSVALRLIVEREDERNAFKADEYWDIAADSQLKKTTKQPQVVINRKEDDGEEIDEEDKIVPKKDNKIVTFNVAKIDGKKPELETEKDVKPLLKKLEENAWKIADLQSRETKRNPSPPFSTSTLQQAAANSFGFSASRTMRAAQKLYEAGHITYMRTDSISLSKDAIAGIRKAVEKNFGKEYIPAKPIVYKTRSKVAQEAHEAIRSTKFQSTSKDIGVSGDEARLYDLIRSRALASQMSPARFESNKLVVKIDNIELHANGKKVLFPGFLKAYGDHVNETLLPEVEVGDAVYPLVINANQHFTQPPGRYSDATLVKALEELGIGRPSTYAPIIQTLLSRKYVEKESRYFIPTDTGIVVTRLLVKHFPDVVDTSFTAGLEDDLDKIANGDKEWRKVMADFYNPFAKHLAKKEKSIERDDFTVLGQTDEKCPECGSKMVIKLGKYGRFLSCTKFPDCKGMLPLDSEGNVAPPLEEQAASEEFKATYAEPPQTEEGKPYMLKRGRFGEFWAHPDYPKVKDAKPLVLRPEIIKERFGDAPKTDDGRDFEFKTGKFGEFWAHPDYPKVKETVRIKKQKKDKEST